MRTFSAVCMIYEHKQCLPENLTYPSQNGEKSQNGSIVKQLTF